MESLDDVLVPVELRYCERCGGLWLRENDGIYCPECVPLMADMPLPRRKRVLVVAVNSLDEIEGCLAELAAAGYKRRDAWRNEGKPIEVPFVEGGDKAFYAGCCFDLH